MSETQKQLTVMIVGAGLGGLTLALLLEKAKINYHVYEKAAEVKPLGMIISISLSNDLILCTFPTYRLETDSDPSIFYPFH